jgi:octaprenyl-diphosphate synthase
MLVTQPSAVVIPDLVAPPAESHLAWKQIVAPAEPFLLAVGERLKEQINAFERDIALYAEYALTGQGKQLRPALVALSGSATGRINDSHVLVAVIIEMVHLATLVHDDVMDEARIRRGRPTLAANWGSEISVLLGDCLFAHALKLAASFPTTEICRAVAAATNTVCSGEILQTQRRKNFELSRAEYLQVLQMKTGELFALSCDLGAYSSGAGAAQRSALRLYGLAIGTAYQVYDDCLDLFGSEAAAGKSLGTDLAKGKLTLPVLLALERASAQERACIQSWIGDWGAQYFPHLLDLLDAHDVLGGSRRVIHQHLQMARQKLTALPQSEGRAGLAGLTEYLACQADSLGASA